jgi:acetyl-CoA carboxylase biotin carboxyl carrier protein
MTDPSSKQDIFDVRKIRRLVELMKEYDLGEIDLREGETRIRLRRGLDPVVTTGAARPVAPVASTPSAGPAAGESPAGNASPQAEEEHLAIIRSPMVGTFYAAPDPDSPPYVKVGDHIGPETTVCIVEAMKVFNQIPAEVSGKIAMVLMENGQPVEFGQPLFKVDTRA